MVAIGKLKQIFPYYISSFILCYVVYIYSKTSSLSDLLRNLVTAIPEIIGLAGIGMNYQYVNSVTWYISAMILACWVCSYILHKNPDFYIHVFAPVTFIMIFAYEASAVGTVIMWNEFSGIVLNSVIRGLEGVCSGAIVYLLVEYIASKERNKVILSLLEFVGYFAVFFYCFIMKTDRNTSLYITLLFPVLIALTASKATYSFDFFNRKIFSFAGVFSLLLYLNHLFVKTRIVGHYFYEIPFEIAFMIYIVFTVLISCIMYLTVEITKKRGRK